MSRRDDEQRLAMVRGLLVDWAVQDRLDGPVRRLLRGFGERVA